MSQRQDILRHLAKGHSLTPMEAFKRYRCLSLSQRCGELRREGWPVESKLVKVGDKRVASYRIPKACRGRR
jgi:hypothetical protein